MLLPRAHFAAPIARHRQARSYKYDVFDWGRMTKEEQGPPRHDLPDDMPKFPFGHYDKYPKSTIGGKPYATPADYKDWAARFKKWAAEAGPQKNQHHEVIQLQPYHNEEEHAKYLKYIETLTDEEKRLQGVTINKDRHQPYHVLFTKERMYEISEPAVHLRKGEAWTTSRFASSRVTTMGNTAVPSWKAVKKCFDPKEPPRNYLKEYREHMAKKKENQAQSIEATSA